VEERYISAGGVRTRYLSAGSGPPLVLLHGLHGLAEHWRWVLPAFAEQFTCYVPELIGHGGTERIRSRYRLDDYTDHLRTILDTLGLERVSIVGNSLGGATAAGLAQQDPDRVDRLVLACPAGFGRGSGAEAVRYFVGLFEVLAGVRTGLLRRWSERLQFAGGKSADPWFFESKEADAIRRRRDPVFRRTTLAQAFGIAALGRIDPARITQPTLIVWGTEDGTLPWERSLGAIDRLPNARLVLLRECGHLPHVECPERFSEQALEFLTADAVG
jgi:pimeloyl-ACP methyl ester carboxylesterase